MTRSQAQSAQIENTRRMLTIEHGDETIRQIDTEINRCIGSGTESLALYEWLFSQYHKDVPVYDYGKMQIKKHFEEATK
jgi:hypothetical protein